MKVSLLVYWKGPKITNWYHWLDNMDRQGVFVITKSLALMNIMGLQDSATHILSYLIRIFLVNLVNLGA